MLRTPRFLAAMLRHTWRTHRRLRAPGADLRTQARMQQQGAQAVLDALGVRLHVEGAVPDRALLIAPNHTSWLDAFVLAAAFPTALAGRADVRQWPFVGWVARTMGVVPVHRERTSATSDFVGEVQRRLAAGVHVTAFPEGTTGDGTCLLPFKTGMFEAVVGTDHAVLPVYHQVVQAGGALPAPDVLRNLTWSGPEASLVRSYRHTTRHAPLVVGVYAGAPIEARGETRKTLAAKTQQAVAALRAAHYPGAG